MKKIKLYFVSTNECKGKEIDDIIKRLSNNTICVELVNKRINEPQDADIEVITKQKAIEAYKETGRTVIVDHTAFNVKSFNNLPGALTSVFWQKLGGENFIRLFRDDLNPAVEAVTAIGFCDGKHIRVFTGETPGILTDSIRGNSAFQWDPVFIPDGDNRTFAEMGEDKDLYSSRRKALEKLVEYVKEELM